MTFNGATTLRSWNRRAFWLASGRAEPQMTFNGATTLRSWNSGDLLPPDEEEAAFNGATTLRSWNSPH